MKVLAFAVITSMAITVFSASPINAQQNYDIPEWVRIVAGFWAEEKISDAEFSQALTFLINQEIIKVHQLAELKQEVIQLTQENVYLKNQIHIHL